MGLDTVQVKDTHTPVNPNDVLQLDNGSTVTSNTPDIVITAKATSNTSTSNDANTENPYRVPMTGVWKTLAGLDKWIDGFGVKDGKIGGGYNAYSSGGRGYKNNLLPNASQVNYLGDISAIINAANAYGMDASRFPFENPATQVSTGSGASSDAQNLLATQKVTPVPKTVKSNFMIDDQKGDTITVQQFNQRGSRSGTLLFRKPDGTLTSTPNRP